jgi:hypothetical protein
MKYVDMLMATLHMDGFNLAVENSQNAEEAQ